MRVAVRLCPSARAGDADRLFKPAAAMIASKKGCLGAYEHTRLPRVSHHISHPDINRAGEPVKKL